MTHYFLKTYSYKNNLQDHLVQCPQLKKDKKIDLAHYFLVLVLVAQLCPTLYTPMDCSHQAPLPTGILHKRILK